jgi:hypothetical protein
MQTTSLFAAALLLIGSVALSAQEPVEWSAETRTSLSFRVKASLVQPLLPPGWNVATQDGTDRTAVGVTFMERHLVLDGRGQQVRTGTTRYMVMSVQARRGPSGPSGTMIVAGISPEGAGAYGVYQSATVARVERTSTGQAEDSGQAEEAWELASAGGDRVTLRLRYRRAVPVRRQSTSTIRSGRRPEFTRTYRVDQASDALGVPGEAGGRIEAVSFTATGPLFSTVFDGSEVLAGVTAIPWYTREIFIP